MTKRKRPTSSAPPDLGGFRPTDAPAPADVAPRRKATSQARSQATSQATSLPPQLVAGAPSRPAARHVRRSPGSSVDGGRSWGKIAAVTLAGLVGLVAVAAAALVAFAPVDLVRDRLVAEVKAKTGRDLVIGRTPSISLVPHLAVTLGDVSLSNPPGMAAAAPLVTMQALEAEVRLWPLLSRQVVVDRLILRQPVVNLRVDGQGRRNWQFAEAPVPSLTRYAQARSATSAGASTSNDASPLPKELEDFAKGASDQGKRRVRDSVEGISLGDIRLDGGMLNYLDERTGVSERIEAIEIALTAASLAAPLDAKGRLSWRGQTLDIAARATPFRAVLEEQPLRLTAVVQGKPIDLAYDGQVTLGSMPEADGKMTLKSGSLAALSAWVGRPVSGGFAAGPLSLVAVTKLAGTTTSLSDLSLTLDGVAVNGALSVDSRSPRPALKGTLKFSALDLDRLGTLRVAPAAASPATPTPQASPQSIDDLLKDGASPAGPKPQVRGFTRRNGWSDDVIDLAALGAVDADLKLSFAKLSSATFQTGAGAITTALKNRVARLTIDDLQLYDGRARGVVTVDATNPASPVIGANLIAEGVSALPLLKETTGFDWLAGKARVSLAVAGQGQTERQIISTLNGKADIAMADGAIVGINIPQILRGLGQGKLGNLDRVPTEKTDFSEFAASVVLTAGVAQNQDLRLASPLLRVTGSGSANLPARTIDYTVKPKIVGSTAGQGGQGGGVNLAGIEVPVRITGSFDKPSIAPDISGVLRNPNQVIEAVKQLDRREVEGAVKGLLNGDGASKQKARDLLNNFLKR